MRVLVVFRFCEDTTVYDFLIWIIQSGLCRPKMHILNLRLVTCLSGDLLFCKLENLYSASSIFFAGVLPPPSSLLSLPLPLPLPPPLPPSPLLLPSLPSLLHPMLSFNASLKSTHLFKRVQSEGCQGGVFGPEAWTQLSGWRCLRRGTKSIRAWRTTHALSWNWRKAIVSSWSLTHVIQ